MLVYHIDQYRCNHFQQLYGIKISSSFAVDLRKAVYKKIEKFSLREMDHFTTSSLITRSTNDIQQIQGFINMMLRLIILQPVLAFGAIIFSVQTQPDLYQ
jgi:ATP-binding cassette, subfamily B, multidrug efflux pump